MFGQLSLVPLMLSALGMFINVDDNYKICPFSSAV